MNLIKMYGKKISGSIKIRIKYFFLHRKRKDFLKKIIKIKTQTKKIIVKRGINKNNQTICFVLPFSIFEPNKLHDFFLAQSLMLRGVKIVPLLEGKLQEGETSTFGGIWGGFNGLVYGSNKYVAQAAKNCELNLQDNMSLWKDWLEVDPIFLDKFITSEEKLLIKKKANEYSKESNFANWVYGDMPVGVWVCDIIRNNELLEDILMVQNYKEKAIGYLYNIILFIEALKKTLPLISPNIIISNNSFYYPWSIVEFLARKMKIPFYCGGPGHIINSWQYAYNARAIPVDLDDLWKGWESKRLDYKQRLMVENDLYDRRFGKRLLINTANPYSNSNAIDSKIELNFAQPTVLLVANVVWDAAALGAAVCFKGMFNWVREVVEFFRKNAQYNLIIKAHPGEKNRYLPDSKQLLENELKQDGSILPRNVVLLGPTSSISFYDIVPYVKAGLTFTSTAGLEMACAGIPVISAGKSPYYGKGFTFDPRNSKDYFDILTQILQKNISEEERLSKVELAYKFYYIYHYIYPVQLKLFNYSVERGPELIIRNAYDLLPGKNTTLDYICDSIINHLPVMSSDRWPKHL